MLLTATVGCSSSTAHVASTSVIAADFAEPMLALPPFIQHVDAKSGQPIEAPSAQTAELAHRLQSAAATALENKGIEVDAVGESQLTGSLQRTPEQTYADLRRLRSTSVNDVFGPGLDPGFDGKPLLATRVRFHRGPSGSWNVNTGQITSAMERMVIDAHVYDLSTGREVWRQTLQLRTRPSIGDAELRDVVDRLFSTLAKK